MPNTPDEHQADARSRLVSRIVDGAATPEDWTTLRTLASGEPDVWAELADTQSQNEHLMAVVGEAVSIAEATELPEEEFDTHPGHGIGRRMEVVRSWGGWAAAAAILLVWTTGIPVGGLGDGSPMSNPTNPTNTAGLNGPRFVPTSIRSADDALQQYIDLGREEGSVIAAMPEEIVLETRALGDGTAEVLYLRQILERRVVDRFYRMGTDEMGRPVPVEDPDGAEVASPF